MGVIFQDAGLFHTEVGFMPPWGGGDHMNLRLELKCCMEAGLGAVSPILNKVQDLLFVFKIKTFLCVCKPDSEL